MTAADDLASWSITASRSVDGNGRARGVLKLIDAVSGEAGTVTCTLTRDRRLLVLVDGIELASFECWSTS